MNGTQCQVLVPNARGLVQKELEMKSEGKSLSKQGRQRSNITIMHSKEMTLMLMYAITVDNVRRQSVS